MTGRVPTAKVARALDAHGRTYAQEAGLGLRDAPSPLYRLLVLSSLLASPVPSRTGVAAARELSRRGWRTPSALLASTPRQRIEALREAGYRRFDERTALRLGACAEAVLQNWQGDLRRVADRAQRDVVEVRRAVAQLPGVGAVARGAQRLGLPTAPEAFARLLEPDDLPRLVAACVRASLIRSPSPRCRTGEAESPE